MDDVTLLVETADGWKAPAASGYVAERELQELLVANPRLIPGLTGDAVAVREFQTEVGPVDLVIVDQAGQVTIVEVKQASNDQSRREIAGQALDYAGRLWEMPVARFEEEWSKRHPEHSSPTELLGLDVPSQEFLAESLALGRFRLVLALDKLNPRLCRLVDYLNQHTADSLTVVAMEFRHWRQADVRMLIPRTHGVEAALAKERKTNPSKETWTDETARSFLVEHHPSQVSLIFDLIADIRSRLGLRFAWTAAVTPSFVVAVRDPSGKESFPYWVVLGHKDLGQLRIPFKWLTRFNDEQLTNFVEELASDPRLGIDAVTMGDGNFKGQPGVPLAGLAEVDVKRTLLDAAESLGKASAGTPT